jgi:hypothetical protein
MPEFSCSKYVLPPHHVLPCVDAPSFFPPQAVFTGAVVPSDQRVIMQLLKRAIVCLVNSSTDEQHTGVRYARMLNGLMRMLSKGVDGAVTPGLVSAQPSSGMPNGDSDTSRYEQQMSEGEGMSGDGGGHLQRLPDDMDKTVMSSGFTPDPLSQISPSSFAGLSHDLHMSADATALYSDLLADNELEADFWKLVVPNDWS